MAVTDLRLPRLPRPQVDRCRPPIALELGACFLEGISERIGGDRER